MKPTRTLSIVVLGEISVGKTSLIERYSNDCFSNFSKSSINVEIIKKDIFMAGNDYSLMLYDTAGSERFRMVSKSWYARGDIILIVCDHKTTLKQIQDHISFTEIFDAKIAFAFNKNDLGDPSIDIINEARSCDRVVGIYRTSAKTGEKVDDLFVNLLLAHAKVFVEPMKEVDLPEVNKKSWWKCW